VKTEREVRDGPTDSLGIPARVFGKAAASRCRRIDFGVSSGISRLEEVEENGERMMMPPIRHRTHPSQPPKERLDVDHVLRAKVFDVSKIPGHADLATCPVAAFQMPA
jgi:hypothetical protein